jgi:hypothetical protein
MPVSRVSYSIKTHFDSTYSKYVLSLQYIYDILVLLYVMYNKIIAVFECWWQSSEYTCLPMKLSLLAQQLIYFNRVALKSIVAQRLWFQFGRACNAKLKLHIFSVDNPCWISHWYDPRNWLSWIVCFYWYYIDKMNSNKTQLYNSIYSYLQKSWFP